MQRTLAVVLLVALFGLVDVASAQRTSSPRGEASTQIGDREGPWIVVDYGRPILRGRRNIFGEGEEYGQAVLSGAPVWRLGANVSTKLTTETALVLGGQTLEAGEYTMFAELSAGSWTLIISNHKGKPSFRSEEEGIWGAYGYSEEMDVMRVPMAVTPIEVAVDQFSIHFFDVTSAGGTMAFIWENTMALVGFTLPTAD